MKVIFRSQQGLIVDRLLSISSAAGNRSEWNLNMDVSDCTIFQIRTETYGYYMNISTKKKMKKKYEKYCKEAYQNNMVDITDLVMVPTSDEILEEPKDFLMLRFNKNNGYDIT